MSTPVPKAGPNTPSGEPTANIDVYARVMQSSFNSGIEEIIIIDGEEQTDREPQVCTCGMCGTNSEGFLDFSATDARASLAGAAPMLYIETRADSDPLVLDEYTVAADIEKISPRLIAQPNAKPLDTPDPQWSQVSLASLIDETLAQSFDPASFNPYDPGIAVASDVL